MSNTICSYLILAAVVFGACKKEDTDHAGAERVENKAPIVSAGPDLHLLYQLNTCILQGSATDPENEALRIEWRKLSGPPQFQIEPRNKAVTRVFNVQLGDYSFELTATDPHGAAGRDTVVVHVYQQQQTAAFSVDAGPNIYVALPNTSALLTGNVRPQDSVANMQWQKVSGPDTYLIENPDRSETRIQNLQVGEYQFRLKVLDVSGVQHESTVNVYVYNPANNEYVHGALEWICPMGCSASFTLPSQVPLAADLQVSVRSSYSTAWLPVKPAKDWSAGGDYVYKISGRTISLYSDYAEGKADVKVKW